MRQSESLSDRQSERQSDRQSERQSDRQSERQRVIAFADFLIHQRFVNF